MGRTIRTTTSATPAPRPELRVKVREALCTLRDGRRAPSFMLLDMVNQLIAEPCTAPECQGAIDWNIMSGFVGTFTNTDMEREEYYITAAGRVKQQQGWSA